jgi:nicotinate-nucleotide--dimethylbenzimidazole phosphoribosyltransferase
MTGTDEFGHELDAQGYERAAGPADGRPDQRAAAPGAGAPGQAPLGGTPRQRGPQPVGRPMQGQLPGRPLPPNAGVPGQVGGRPPGQPAQPQDTPWLATPGASGVGYPEAAFGGPQRPNPMPGVTGMPQPMEIDSTAPQPRLTMPAPGPGHDAPTAEFYPLYDAGAPEDYQVPPAPVPAPAPPQRPVAQQQPGAAAGPIPAQAGAPAAAPQPAPMAQQPGPGPAQHVGAVPPPAASAAPYAPPLAQDSADRGGYPEQEFDPLSGSASWSAAPPRAAQAVQQQAPRPVQQAQRPAVPAQPLPAPVPLPERGPARSGVRSTGGGIAAAGAVAAGRAAVRQQQADAAAQTEADPLSSSGQRTVTAQAQVQQQPSVPQQQTTVPQQQPVQARASQQQAVPQQQPVQAQVQQQPSVPQQQPVQARASQQQAVPQQQQSVPQQPPVQAPPRQQPQSVPQQSVPQQAASVFEPGAQPAPEVYQDPQSQSGRHDVRQEQGSASPSASGVRESMAPPRRRVSGQPPQGAAAPAPANSPAADDLSSANLRSVAPAVPAPRRVPEDSAGDLPPLPPRPAKAARQQPAPAPAQQAPQQFEESAPEADELVVPWQAVAPQGNEPAPRGTRRRADNSVDETVPEALSAPMPVLLDPEPGEEEDFAAQSGTYEPEYAEQEQAEAQAQQQAKQQEPGEDDPLSGSGSHARPQPQQQPQPQSAQVEQQPPVQSAQVEQQQPPTQVEQQPASAPEPVRQAAVEQPAAKPVAKPAVKPAPRPAAPAKAPAPAPAAPAAEEDRAPGYGEAEMEAVYRVIHERRDIRNDFLPDELPIDVLTRILEAAHTAPSVGFSQPWDFLVLRDEERRRAVHDLAVRQRKAYAASLPKARAKAFAALKIEAILDTPVNIVVTCDPTRGGRHTLGRYTQPMMAPFSTCLAVENLWLAARAEGLGVGWVSFFDERELSETLGLPEHLQIVAYLCVGYVKRFPSEPELAGAGWARRRPLSWAVHEEDYGRRAMPGGDPVSMLDATVDAVRGLDEDAAAAARERQARMTKPPGSLGMLEHVAEQLAGLAGECPPPLPEPAALAVFAADHGVHAQGVTPWPQEVTAQMVANFLAGGAVVNAFAKQVGAEVCVVDVGVNANLGNASGLVPRKIRFGTADMTQGPALTRDEVMAAIEAGIETSRDLVAAGNRCLLTGDMGIANTTASAALIAAFTGASPAQVTGYGTGIDEQTYAHKVEIVRRALELHRPDPQDPIGVLAAFGGLEHAALAGFILGGAALRTPVVLDGVIAGAAALVAQAIAPEVTVACVAGHRSAEPGHALALEALGINPLIDLELRLGEGSGAVLALPLVASAVRALREVATFDSAGVADASAEAVVPRTRDQQ